MLSIFDVHQYWLLWTCKSKPQWDIILQWSEWLLSKKRQKTLLWEISPVFSLLAASKINPSFSCGKQQQQQQITSVSENVEKREPLCTVAGDVNWCSHYENSMEFPQKIKNRTALWSSSPTSGYIPKNWKQGLRCLCTHVHSSSICNSQEVVTQILCSIDEWIKKIWYVHKMKYYSASKKERNPVVCYKMSEPWGHCTKWNNLSQKDKYHMIPLIWGI